MKKFRYKLLVYGMALMLTVMVPISATAGGTPNGQPFQEIWEELEDLQDQIDEHEHPGEDITSGKIDNARLCTGHGNGLDADTVDGMHASDLECKWSESGSNLYYLGGNVGIGTTSPMRPLHVHEENANSYIRISNDHTAGEANSILEFYEGSTHLASLIARGSGIAGGPPNALNIYTYQVGAPITLGTASGEKIRIADNGNVGIGTASPSEKLDVAGNVHASGSFIAGSTTTYGNGYISMSPGTNLDIDSGTLFIDNTLNRVGIGTTAPSEQLDIFNSGGSSANIRLDSSSASAGSVIYRNGESSVLILDGGSGTASGRMSLRGSQTSFLPGHITFDTGNAIRMVIDQNGKVGIGTTSPAEKLHVAGNLKVDGDIIIPATKRYLSIPPGGFTAEDNWLTYKIDFHASYHNLRGTNAGPTVIFYAPVQLPDGAKITEFTAFIKDSDATEDISVELLRYRPSTGATGGMTGALYSSGTPGRSTLSTTSIAFATMDSSEYVYLVRVMWKVPTTVTDIHLEGVFIEYEITTPLP